MNRSIIWFRDDLRLRDNEAFSRAAANSDEIIPIYIWDEGWFASGHFGAKRIGPFREKFIQESLDDLSNSLGSLIIRKGDPTTIISDLAKQLNVTTVYCNSSYTSFEKDQEDILEQKGFQLYKFHSSTLIHPEDLPMPLEDLPDVFSNFRKKVEKLVKVRAEVDTPNPWTIAPEGEELSKTNYGAKVYIGHDPRAVMSFEGGENKALERLDRYLWGTDALSTYKKTRNGLIGADYSSKFSAWLAVGAISAKQIYHAVKRYEDEVVKNSSTYWMIFELLWRDYFKFVSMKFGSAIFHSTGIKGNSDIEMQWKPKAFELWAAGRTGQKFVDANMIELNLTGFMSNRGRQNVASYLIKDLGVDWRAGAEYFERMLIDYDPCSNYGNWQYVAGVGNDPRENRYFNVPGQADRYDPEAEYRRLWLGTSQ